MSRTRLIALIAVLLLTAPLAGCLQADDGPEDEDQPLNEAAVEDMAAAESFTMEMEMESTTTVGNETVEQRVTTEGAVDREAREMSLEQRVHGNPQLGNQTTRMVVLNDSAYVEGADRWRAAPLPMNPWEQAGAEGNVELLEEANVTRTGTETIDGVETAVFEVNASGDVLKDAAREQLGSFGGMLDSVSIDDATIHQYVAVEEPNYVYRVDVNMTMTMDAPEGSATVESSQTIRYDDFEEDVEVDVPDAVRERHES